MLVWQIVDGNLHSINLHHDYVVLWIQVDVTVEKKKALERELFFFF